jgi:hypothetical protein
MDRENRNPGRLMSTINYSIAALFALLGILILAGYPIQIQGEIRWVLGSVLLLWSIYRAITTRTKFPIS